MSSEIWGTTEANSAKLCNVCSSSGWVDPTYPRSPFSVLRTRYSILAPSSHSPGEKFSGRVVEVSKGKIKAYRCGQGSNLCGQSPLDFKSNSLTTRTPQLVARRGRHTLIRGARPARPSARQAAGRARLHDGLTGADCAGAARDAKKMTLRV